MFAVFPFDVFLSHDQADNPRVWRLTERLRAAIHGLWGMGQIMLTKYLVEVDVHNTNEVLFHLCDGTEPQRDSIFSKGPADVLDPATNEIATGSKLGLDATKKLPGEGSKRPWPPHIKMDAAVKAKVERIFASITSSNR